MKHVWLADHYSVPMETLCMRRAPSPNADHFCLKAKGHHGACECTFAEAFKVRDFSHKDGRSQTDTKADDDPCGYCADHAPPGKYWVCPKCDAEWLGDENAEADHLSATEPLEHKDDGVKT